MTKQELIDKIKQLPVYTSYPTATGNLRVTNTGSLSNYVDEIWWEEDIVLGIDPEELLEILQEAENSESN